MKLGPPHICIVQLGHYGDVINLLPVAYYWHRQGQIVHWFLFPEAKREIFEAVSYVHPVDLPVPHALERAQLRAMVGAASQAFEQVIVASHRDMAAQGALVAQSYNRESWRLAGMLHEWDNPDMVYCLDKFEWPEPPRTGILPVSGLAVPIPILVNLTHGQSSPFIHGRRLLEQVQHAFPGAVMDIGPARFPKFLDLLSIIHLAKVFVSIDSGTLWLSEFLPDIPTIALVNHAEWSGSILHRRLDARISYREAVDDPRILIAAIERRLGYTARPGWENVGAPVRVAKWPEVFARGYIDGETDVALRYAAIKAWAEVLEGSPPGMFFDKIMREIADRLDCQPHDLIEFQGRRRPGPMPNLP